MKKFLVLYMASPASIDEMIKNTTPEQRQAGMDAWTEWMNAHKDVLADMGTPVGKNKRVTEDGASDVRNDVCGYSLVNAESYDAAVALFDDSPHFQIKGGYIEILECLTM